jgi:integrase
MTRNPKEYPELEQVQKRLNPRDKAFFALLERGVRISQAIQLKVGDINFQTGTLTITNFREKSKLKCPHCGGSLSKKNLFCPTCGNRVGQALCEKVEQRQQRTICIDRATLALIEQYLTWRRRFPYRGTLVFPFSRQRGWQLLERIRRRAGIEGR